jgi:NAD(P)-dependent dehydrogenase (short-subunit alcohol dehydrogenase family)
MVKFKWDGNNIPNQKDRAAIITGSSSGIGYEAARVLTNKEAEVIIAVRNAQKGEAALQKIKEQNKNANVSVMILDLASLESVKKFAEEFNKKYSRLDLLINNAGVMIPPYSKTADGFELQMGTNHFGHFALTGLLMDLLLKTDNSRIVNISSAAHKYGRLDFEDLNWENRKYKAWNAYGDSKIASLYFTYELQRRLHKTGSRVLATAAHPGWTATNLQRHSGFFEFLNKFFAMNIEQGTLPTLRAAVDDEVKGGEFFGPDGWQERRGYPVKVKSNTLSQDSNTAKKLWDVSEELTGVKYSFN